MQKTSIISILLCMTVISAHGDIASKAYVDSVSSDIQAQIDERANKSGYTPERILQTDGSGNVTADLLRTDMISDGAVTNSKLASNIGLDKLDMGTLPTSGKHILIWNGTTQKYVFEAYAESASSGLQCSAGTYDIGFSQCIDLTTNGSTSGYRNDSTGAHGANSSKTDVYGLTTDQTWGVTFNGYGIIKGIASCNGTNGTFGQSTTDNFSQTDTGQYCWCKMTEPAASRWVFDRDYNDAASCANYCASDCGNGVRFSSDLRSGVIRSVGN